jgi:hypothetical protein
MEEGGVDLGGAGGDGGTGVAGEDEGVALLGEGGSAGGVVGEGGDGVGDGGGGGFDDESDNGHEEFREIVFQHLVRKPQIHRAARAIRFKQTFIEGLL